MSGGVVDSNTLKWVKSEIDETLNQAQTALSAYVEDTDDDSQMRFCINYLHQVHGTLQMVELYGAALAVEEMEKLAQAIFDDNVNNKNDAYETLMRGILQVPDYLEHLMAGNPDMPVVLLPLLNDLRAARNEALLSEGALFTPDLSINAPPVALTINAEAEGLPSLARKLRHNYHLGLLSWFQNKNPKAGLQKINDVLDELTKVAESDEARRVLWVASGLVESLKEDGLEPSVSVKMLLGQVDRQIKKIIDEGEFALEEAPPEDLEKNLLFYVASSTTAGDLTKQIKDTFNLKAILPDTHTLEQARADMTAPNAALMQTVSSVIIEDINRVKDNLDVYVRAEDKDMSIIETVHASLVQMADTLAMLSLGVQRSAVLKQCDFLSEVISGKQQADDKALMDVAAAMIAVENSLSEVSSARAASAIEVEEGVDAGETALAQLQGAEQQKLMQSVLDEAKVNLAKVKDALTVFSRNNEERDELKAIPGLLEQIKGSLQILSLSDAEKLLSITINYIRDKLIKETIPPSYDDMNNLADAISSLEYYMESLMGNWGQPDAILKVAEQSLQALGLNTDEAVETKEADVEIIAEETTAEEEISLSAEPEPIIEADLEQGTEPELSSGTIPELTLDDVESDFAAGSDASFDLNGTLEEPLETALDEDISLNDISLELSDVAEALSLDENESDVPLHEFSFGEISLEEDDSAALPGFEIEETALEEPEPVKAETTEQHEAAEPPQKSASANEPSLLDDTIDDEIIEIFLEEAEEAFESISSLLPLWVANRGDEESLREIRRAFHTLKGSGRLVGATDVGEFAWSYENMLNRVLEHTITVSPELIEIMERGKQALPELFDLFKHGAKPGPEILALMQYADALSQGESINLEAAENTVTEAEAEPEAEIETIIPIEITEEPEIEILDKENLPPVDIDPVLLDIYRKEVATHIDSLKQYINDWNSGKHEASQNLLRALHTLTGSSRTTGVQSLALVCSNFEHYIKHLQDIEIPVPRLARDELEATIMLIELTVDCLDVPGAELPEYEKLLARIEALPKDAEVEAVTAAAKPVTVEEPATELPVPDYDEELLEIFLEEGTEILDESDQTIHDWIENPSDQSLVELLQRQLHTLKGGARMAGIAELGDLGHNIESLLTAVVDGHMKPSKAMLDLVQRAQDRLVKMLELVQQRKGLAPATELNREVDLMLANRGEGDELAESLEIEAPASETEAPVIEDEIEIQPAAEFESQLTSEPEIVADDLSSILDESTRSPEMEIPDYRATDREVPPEADVAEVTHLAFEDEPEVSTADENVINLERKTVSTEETRPVSQEEGDRRQAARVQGEQVRVRADLLDNLVNFAGEVSIYRSRLEQQTNNFRYNITEFDDTVNRLREQLRQFEIETEAQIEYRHESTLSTAQEEFDPLEMDRFTTMQHLSRAMMESLGDLDSLRGILNNLTRESETLLLQQSRVNTDLQEGLMRTRMVSFSGQAARLRRIVRQTCSELGKHAELNLHGVDSELDRTVLERIIPPIEHMLRNAVAHGIESPADRKKAGKAESGTIDFSISREGTEIKIRIKDDGAGINLEAIRSKAISRGLIKEGAAVSKDMLLEMIMQSGFSTAETVNQIAGRGVGMDVVNTEIKQLGGIFNIDTEKNKGTTFTVSLPMTLAISRALMVMIGEETYAIPLLSVEGVERITAGKIREIQAQENPAYEWVGENYSFMHLGTVMGLNELTLGDDKQQFPMLMVRSGDNRAAILVDTLLGSREIVVKPVGPQLSTLRGISGATIMGDGSVVLIVDLGVLVRLAATAKEGFEIETPVAATSVKVEDTKPVVMVVDDSITVRKVTTRLLERHEMSVVAAKDGVDALAQLQETIPDIMLLDVEMPRMDGFELATNMRNDERLKNIPIIMITSRTGQKHRDRASSIGVNIYMGKPYTEADLLDNINVLTGRDL